MKLSKARCFILGIIRETLGENKGQIKNLKVVK